MPEIPLKISRAIICKKARELRHNNFMGQGQSALCNFAERASVPKGIENPEKEEPRCDLDVRKHPLTQCTLALLTCSIPSVQKRSPD